MQHFCQVFLFYISALVCGCSRGLARSFLCVLFIYKQHHLSAAISLWNSPFPPSLPPALIPLAALKMGFAGIVFLLLNCIFCEVLGVCVCVCFLYYIMQATARLGESSSFADSSESVLSCNLAGRVCSLLRCSRLSYCTQKPPASLTITPCICNENKQTR